MVNRIEIGRTIAQAIKNSMFLNVTYINQNSEVHKFWLAVTDILFDAKNPIIQGKIYNPDRNIDNCIDASRLFFNSIRSAEIINFTHYDVPSSLLEKLQLNIGKCSWLEEDTDVRVLLDYYEKCYQFDKDPYQHEHDMIKGLDCELLLKERTYALTSEQKKDAIAIIRQFNNKEHRVYQFAISKYAIDNADNHTYIICYYDVVFNPIDGTLSIDNTLRFNYTFLSKRAFEDKVRTEKSSLFKYAEGELEEFIELFKNNEEEAIEIIKNNLRGGEILNTRPEVMILEREFNLDLQSTFNAIVERERENKLAPPLKSFLGKTYTRHRKNPDIIICDDKINIDQARVIYNAMQQPVTYVQGPPGTGKTQTILNVILNAFYSDRTTLVCSSNNKPVDGILEKLNIDYLGESIPFPFIRLGNYEQMERAMEQIVKFYEYQIKHSPDDRKLSSIKTSTNAHHIALKDMLARQERHANYESMLESANLFQHELEQYRPSKLTENIQHRVKYLEETLQSNPRVENEEIQKLFVPLERNHWLKQYMYFSALKCIERLKAPANRDLIDICLTKDEEERHKNFITWLSSNANMKRFIRIFPVIFSTNISSHRLGSPDFMFDLVIMDEAGQCNIVQSLIPITKANALLLVGDPQQLRPVVVLENLLNDAFKRQYSIPDSYDYKQNSILDVMRSHDRVSNYVLLKYHYRCGSDIIAFSNKKYYNSALNLSAIKNRGELVSLSVPNKNVIEKNAAYDEALAIVEYVIKHQLTDVSIITPFVNQKDLINLLLKKKNVEGVECFTVHKMQGAEKDTIIFSTALSPKTSQRTFEWLKNNEELINVGVTRAKNRLVIANDYEVAKALSQTPNDLLDLIEYVRSNGRIQVPLNELVKVEIGKSNNSRYEAEFYRTIAQFCSVHSTFAVKRNVSFSEVFSDDEVLRESAKEFDCVLYEKHLFSNKPKIAIEINGGEHFGNLQRQASDVYKVNVCKQKGIVLLMIPNTFVKSYLELTNIILHSRNASDTQSSFDFEG